MAMTVVGLSFAPKSRAVKGAEDDIVLCKAARRVRGGGGGEERKKIDHGPDEEEAWE
jgi:hypothetical protein